MIIARHAIRAILLTDAHQVLLMRIHPPTGGNGFWITPGGGVERGESTETALRRELKEELGLEGFDLGPLLWRRQHTFNWGERRICQREVYHVVHTHRFEPHMSDPTEAKLLEAFRWWSASELEQAQEPLTPVTLAQIVRRYIDDGAVADPTYVEVLVD